MILQRASAGSGKTFKLAKTFIRLFIARRDKESGRYILLPPKALRERHSHILGVTFTNKATNEMKERIVTKLAALARQHPQKGFEPEGWKAPDYLLDFTGERDDLSTDKDEILFTPEGEIASRNRISASCREALKILLNDYGNFNISTIDTFFQGVLRTFAYELRLNENYAVELNDDFLAQVGVDHTLSMINSSPASSANDEEKLLGSYVHSWVRNTIFGRLDRGENWNIFNKSADRGVYGELLDLAKKMNRETFKLNVAKLNDYFEEPERFSRFLDACHSLGSQVKELHKAAIGLFNQLYKKVEEYSGEPAQSQFSGMSGAISYLRSLKPHSKISVSKLGAKLSVYYCECPPPFDGSGRKHFLKKECPVRDNPELTSLFTQLGGALFKWQRERAYRETILSRLHYMGMLHLIRHNSELFRLDNNLIPLSSSNEILSRIISNDDTPFIYERIGTRLDHYLLDEFQDTSEMQWRNLLPLLRQSTDTDEECLIIGDAKQSIYRFRNAEPDIINNQVTAELPMTRELPSPTASPAVKAAINTNYRSSDMVVRANNTIFTLLPVELDNQQDSFLSQLYSGAVQKVHNKELPGYVRINFDSPVGMEYNPTELDDEQVREMSKEYYSQLGYLIDSLRERGYRLSDIAILVNRNTEGADAINALLEHNGNMLRVNRQYQPIEVLSEESLKVSESAAVKVILAVLTAIAKGFRKEDAKTEKENLSPEIRQVELAQFVANFHCYFATHRDEPLDSILKKDLDTMLPPSEIQEMLRASATSALPALVEAIAAKYTSALGGEQAPYISAFQDAVLEYCENYPADVASFLAWWDENGDKCSIAAPEGVDALRVMTIHKSKGLEFDVVIIPKADWNPYPSQNNCRRELIWVSHCPRGLEERTDIEVPPVMPVTPSPEMADTDSPFHEAYEEYVRERVIDELNKTYVAFTRAVRELHVYAPIHKTRKKDTVLYIGDHLLSALSALSAPHTPTDPSLLLTPSDYHLTLTSLTAGTPTHSTRKPTPVDTPNPSTSTSETSDPDIIIIDSYATPDPPAQILTLSEPPGY